MHCRLESSLCNSWNSQQDFPKLWGPDSATDDQHYLCDSLKPKLIINLESVKHISLILQTQDKYIIKLECLTLQGTSVMDNLPLVRMLPSAWHAFHLVFMLFPVLEQTINVSIALVTNGAIAGSDAWLAWRKLVTFPTQRTPCGFILSLSLQARTPTSRRRARRKVGKRSELALCSIRCQLSLKEK